LNSFAINIIALIIFRSPAQLASNLPIFRSPAQLASDIPGIHECHQFRRRHRDCAADGWGNVELKMSATTG
jgi:hypothetical protein